MEKSTSPVIKMNNVTISQDSIPILENINFNIFQGEFIFLIGRTGSGKSSILKTLYGDLPLHSGEGSIAGFKLKGLEYEDIPCLRRRLGIVFQDFQLLTDRTVEENLLFVLEATGWEDKFNIKQRISEVLLQVGLSGTLKKMPHQLSGGEQQRLVIARALLNDPLILLADEPTGNLDPEVAEGILSLFFEINRGGTAVLMATHNHNFVVKYPKRVLTCINGRVVES